jgi:hypothetical protein
MSEKLTKQGVRDLNDIKAKPARKLAPPPKLREWCRHVRVRDVSMHGDSRCVDCGLTWDWSGIPYDDDD